MKLHMEVSNKMCVIYVSEYVPYLHIKQTIPSEYVMGILHFTKQLFCVGSFINTFYKSQIWEKIHRFLQFPSESCKPQICDPGLRFSRLRDGASNAANVLLSWALGRNGYLANAGRTQAASQEVGSRQLCSRGVLKRRGLLCSLVLLYCL